MKPKFVYFPYKLKQNGSWTPGIWSGRCHSSSPSQLLSTSSTGRGSRPSRSGLTTSGLSRILRKGVNFFLNMHSICMMSFSFADSNNQVKQSEYEKKQLTSPSPPPKKKKKMKWKNSIFLQKHKREDGYAKLISVLWLTFFQDFPYSTLALSVQETKRYGTVFKQNVHLQHSIS